MRINLISAIFNYENLIPEYFVTYFKILVTYDIRDVVLRLSKSLHICDILHKLQTTVYLPQNKLELFMSFSWLFLSEFGPNRIPH